MLGESVVNFLITKIGSLWKGHGDAEKGKLLEEAHEIRKELEMMRAFLKDADARADTEAVAKEWVKQVREAVYDIEDVLDEFELFQLQQSSHLDEFELLQLQQSSHPFTYRKRREQIEKFSYRTLDFDVRDVEISLREESYSFIDPDESSTSDKSDDGRSEDRLIAPFSNEDDVLDEFKKIQRQQPIQRGHRFTYRMIENPFDKIQELRTRVVEISARRERYTFIKPYQGSTSNTSDDRTSNLRSIARFSKEDDLVGVENQKKELIEWLVEGGSGRNPTTIAVAGMGGVGKTTLAGKVYYSDPVKAHFECRAWITVSQSFQVKDIFKSMVKEFYGSSSSSRGVEDMEIGKLIETLQDFLGRKRYVIVLDDLWKTEDWQRIKGGLPEGKVGSRIMVTTRETDVATSCAEASRIYHLQPLSFEDSQALFCKNAFRSEYAEQGGSCPPHLEHLSKKIVEKCRGLPLAIVTIGGLLSNKKKTPIEWQNLYDRIGYEIESNPNLDAMNKILSLSIDDLSYDLKPCFFYLSMFPEDHLIERMRLVRLWIAEGFVEEKMAGTLDLEDVADSYLQELINRSLIQVAKRNRYGKVHAFRVHDIVREIILSKSRKWNFVAPFQKQNPRQNDEIRRLSIHRISGTAPKDGDFVSMLRWNLRSLIIFPSDYVNVVAFTNLRLLKVLDLEGASIERFPPEILSLQLLRFLSLRGTRIDTIPSSIERLRNLVTLDLRRTDVLSLPAEIGKLKCLRYLLVFSYQRSLYKIGVQVADGVVGSITSLQKLAYIDAGRSWEIVREVGMLTQLRILGICNLPAEAGAHLGFSLEKMERLNKLSVSASGLGCGRLDIAFVSSPPPLEHLRLEGRLSKELPRWILSLSTLTQLELKNSDLKEDPFKALQYLPNLMFLDLKGAYNGAELCCESGGFRCLNYLSLAELRELKTVKVEEGALPYLQKLVLYGCYCLQKVPLGIQHLSNLKELLINPASKELYRSISSDGGEDYWKISHIPFRKI